jgi:hypothetical protein
MGLDVESIISIVIYLKATDTLTVIIGGEIDSQRIVTFDWTTMADQVQAARFQGRRVVSSCGLLKNKYGHHLVAVAGER